MSTEQKYKFPSEKTKSEQFDYVCSMMDDVEENTYGELIFAVDIDYKGQYHVEIFEHPEDEDDDKELVDWYVGQTIESVFDFLMERYL